MLDASTIVGLGTLDALKQSVLPPALAANGVEYDASLAAIGRGVAAQFDRYTGRRLARVVNGTWEGSADWMLVTLPAYPVESVASVEMLYAGQLLTDAPAWSDVTGSIWADLDRESGLLSFSGDLGSSGDRVRVTYTGGYFVCPGPGEDGEPTPLPEGATAVPDDLFSAWTFQCATELQARDVFGVGVVRDTNTKSTAIQFAASLSLVPQVVATLNSYRRLF